MAYNEAANIGKLLDALTRQELKDVVIKEIIVVSSGSTDGTNEIVQQATERDQRIRLVIQERREGKASAINLFLKQASEDIIVLESADTLPEPWTIEALISRFSDPYVGMVGGHPVPVNLPDTFLGFGVNLLWELHHQLSLVKPKMGELISFRNIFRHIPNETAVDEASIEPLIIGQGLRLDYAPRAVIYNCGPSNLRDYIKQRRRIFSGHIYVKETLGYRVSTMNSMRIACLFIRNLKADWRYWIWAPGIILLEVICRSLGYYDYKVLKKKPYVWSIVETTKIALTRDE